MKRRGEARRFLSILWGEKKIGHARGHGHGHESRGKPPAPPKRFPPSLGGQGASPDFRARARARVRARFFPLLFLSGCMVGPNYTPPVLDVPDTWVGENTPDPTNEASLKTWWEVFQDPLLNKYITKAEECNYNLLVAEQNILRARAIKQISSSQLFPHLSGDLNGTKTYFSKNGPLFAIGPAANNSTVTSSPLTGLPFAVQIPQIQNLFNALFDATWELDLFGKTRRAMEAAEAEVGSAIEERNDILVSLYAEVAKNYMELRGFQTQKDLLEKNIAIFKEIDLITQAQYAAGYVNALDLEQSAANVEIAEALLPDVVGEIYRNIYTLSILLGELPENLVDELLAPNSLPQIPQTIHTGLRSDLLRRRPDIRKAERELAAATAAIGVAVASFFPTVSLLGLGGFQSLQLPELLQWGSRTWAYGADVSMPLYQGGRLVGNLHLTQAVQKAAAYTYQQVVLNALQNAESALMFYEQGLVISAKRHEVVDHTGAMVAIAGDRFLQGLTNKQAFLTTEKEWVQTQIKATQSDTALLVAAIALYKALGGGG